MAITTEDKEYYGNGLAKLDLCGGADDTMPVGTFGDYKIADGSTYIDWDDGEMYRYVAKTKEWKRFGG